MSFSLTEIVEMALFTERIRPFEIKLNKTAAIAPENCIFPKTINLFKNTESSKSPIAELAVENKKTKNLSEAISVVAILKNNHRLFISQIAWDKIDLQARFIVDLD